MKMRISSSSLSSSQLLISSLAAVAAASEAVAAASVHVQASDYEDKSQDTNNKSGKRKGSSTKPFPRRTKVVRMQSNMSSNSNSDCQSENDVEEDDSKSDKELDTDSKSDEDDDMQTSSSSQVQSSSRNKSNSSKPKKPLTKEQKMKYNENRAKVYAESHKQQAEQLLQEKQLTERSLFPDSAFLASTFKIHVRIYTANGNNRQDNFPKWSFDNSKSQLFQFIIPKRDLSDPSKKLSVCNFLKIVQNQANSHFGMDSNKAYNENTNRFFSFPTANTTSPKNSWLKCYRVLDQSYWNNLQNVEWTRKNANNLSNGVRTVASNS